MTEQTTPRARLAEFLRDLLASTPKRPDRLYAGLNSIALADLEALADPNPCDRVEQARASRRIETVEQLDALPQSSIVIRNGVPYTKTETGWSIGYDHRYTPESLLLNGNAALVYLPEQARQ